MAMALKSEEKNLAGEMIICCNAFVDRLFGCFSIS